MFCRRHHVRRLALFGSVLRDAALSQAEDEIASGKAVSAADVLRELRDAK